jgi:hypothetical protein
LVICHLSLGESREGLSLVTCHWSLGKDLEGLSLVISHWSLGKSREGLSLVGKVSEGGAREAGKLRSWEDEKTEDGRIEG